MAICRPTFMGCSGGPKKQILQADTSFAAVKRMLKKLSIKKQYFLSFLFFILDVYPFVNLKSIQE
jgi:hypothetical protein